MKEIYSAAYVSLHVRKTNRAAIALYKDTLGFAVKEIDKEYCEFTMHRRDQKLIMPSDNDGEDALAMRMNLT